METRKYLSTNVNSTKKLRKLFLLVAGLVVMSYICLLYDMHYFKTNPRLWLCDVKVNIDQLIDDNVTIGKDFIISENNRLQLESYAKSFRSIYSRTGLSCSELFKGSPEAIHKSQEYMKHNIPPSLGSDYYYNATKNCSEFIRKRGYLTMPESEEEASFPIAFSILIYTDFQLVERLLRSIYAPQNYYCLHIDAKANDEVIKVLRKVSDCFPNVFLPKKMISVAWGHISIMHAEMICMEELLKFKWKYFINLSGMMFPLRSNSELVRVLKLFKGANDVEGSHLRTKSLLQRVRQLVEWHHSNLLNLNIFTFHLKTPPPHNVTLFTGSNQVILSRAFVVYFLYSEISHDLIDWFSSTLVPDEYIWSTLNHNLHLMAPGSFKGDSETKKTISRLTLWSFNRYWICRGFFQRNICVFGVGDLQWIIKQPHLFVNKFHSNFEWLTIDCMEELIFNRTVESLYKKINKTGQIISSPVVPLDISFYRSLPWVINNSINVISLEESLLMKYIQKRNSSL